MRLRGGGAAVIGVKDDAGPGDAVIKDHKVFADKGIISILVVDAISGRSVGKINRKELRELYGDM